MRNEFVASLKTVFSDHIFDETILSNTSLFVYETAALNTDGHLIKHTILGASEPTERHFSMSNTDSKGVSHICIDGDFIVFGQQKYDDNSSKKADGRPESIIFDENKFLFLELKVEQEELSWDKEDTKWKIFFGGITQIEDFVGYWRSRNFEIKNYYTNIKAVVCMRFEPNFSIKKKGNNARNNEIFKRSQRLGFRIIAHNHQNSYQI